MFSGAEAFRHALFDFARTSNSFHGVEPITEADICRALLLYDIRLEDPAPFLGMRRYCESVAITIKL